MHHVHPPPHPSTMRSQYAVVPYTGAREIVASETRGSGLCGCLLFALMPVGIVAGLVGVIAAVLTTDYQGEYVGGGLVALVIVVAMPWVAFMIRKSRKVRALLRRMTCPRCHGATVLTVDFRTNRYQLVCDVCRVLWRTDIGAPRSR